MNAPDVGLLATGRELCEVLAGLRTDRPAAVERLRSYRDKDTVYDDIVLLVSHLIRANGGRLLIPVLDPLRLVDRLGEPEPQQAGVLEEESVAV